MKKLVGALSFVFVASVFANPVVRDGKIYSSSCDVQIVKEVAKATVFPPRGGICTKTINLPATEVAKILKEKGYNPTIVERADEVKDGLVVFGTVNGIYLPSNGGYDSCLIHISKHNILVGHGTGGKLKTNNTYANSVLIRTEVFDTEGYDFLSWASKQNYFDANSLLNCAVE